MPYDDDDIEYARAQKAQRDADNEKWFRDRDEENAKFDREMRRDESAKRELLASGDDYYDTSSGYRSPQPLTPEQGRAGARVVLILGVLIFLAGMLLRGAPLFIFLGLIVGVIGLIQMAKHSQ